MSCVQCTFQGAQRLSGRVLDSRPRYRGFEPHRRHCVVVLEQDSYHSLVLVQPWKTRPCLTERFLMGRKESNQTNINVHFTFGPQREKSCFRDMQTTKAQTSLRGCTVWSRPLLFTYWQVATGKIVIF